MNREPRPVSITSKSSTSELVVVWEDGHTSTYPYSLLRSGCPCAECRGGHDKMGAEPDPAVFDSMVSPGPQVTLKTIQSVGTYAINLVWEDGHAAGIYSWQYLRKLCPCPTCRR